MVNFKMIYVKALPMFFLKIRSWKFPGLTGGFKMKYQCMGFFDQEKMDALPKDEIDAIMQECQPHLDKLYKSGHLLMDAGVDKEVKSLQRVDGKIQVFDNRFAEPKRILGSVFIIEAHDMEEAIQVATMHPTVQVTEGELLGWEIEIRPIHSFEMKE
jgi:hypothetical protein